MFKIKGKPGDTSNINAVVDELTQLDPGFEERTTRTEDVVYPESSRARTLNNEAWDAVDNNQPSVAAQKFRQAAEAGKAEGNKLAQANDLTCYAQVRLQMGASADARGALETAMNIYEEGIREGKPYFDKLFIVLGDLYKAVMESALTWRANGSEERAKQEEEYARKLSRRSAEILPRCRNVDVVSDAHWVEQGEIGISNKAPMGTANVSDCICIAARDPVTNTTAFAHVPTA